MNDSIKETRAKLEQILERLPPAWPQKLVFAHLPTLQSPEYLSPVNFLRPNEGFYCLDEGHPANRSFLEFQNWLASTIEMYQIIDTVDAKTLMDELYHTALGLDSLKREHWNRSRLSLAIGMFSLPLVNLSEAVLLQILIDRICSNNCRHLWL